MISPGVIWILVSDYFCELLGSFCVVFDKVEIVFDKRDTRSAGLLGGGD
jgi:hypothetical protein